MVERMERRYNALRTTVTVVSRLQLQYMYPTLSEQIMCMYSKYQIMESSKLRRASTHSGRREKN